jgi:hypothetical protein
MEDVVVVVVMEDDLEVRAFFFSFMCSHTKIFLFLDDNKG